MVRDLAQGLAVGVLAASMLMLGLSPLLLPAGVVLAVSLWLIRYPDAALRIALLAVLLPSGLVPALLQSGLEAGSICLAAVAVGVAHRRSTEALAPSLSVCLLAGFVFWALLTLWWTSDLALGVDLLRRYALALLLLILVVMRTNSREAVDRLLRTLACSAWILVGCGLFALLAGNRSPDGRLQVLEMNSNQVGNLLLLVTPGVLWLAVAPVRGTRARSAAVPIFLGSALVLIAQSGSRGSLLAYILLLLGFTMTRTLRRWGLTATALALALALLVPSVFTTVLDRLRLEDPTQLSRTTLWSSGLSLMADHPWGVGLGEGPYVMPEYINARASQDHLRDRDQYPAHNPLIEVGTDTGVIGLMLYASGLVAAAISFVASVGRAKHGRDEFWLAYGAVVGTCSLAFLLVWWKSGGESYSFTSFVMLALWLVGSRAHAAASPAATRVGVGSRRIGQVR